MHGLLPYRILERSWVLAIGLGSKKELDGWQEW
jgi:hypothetical protein